MSIWHTQKAFEFNGLYECRKMLFDGGDWCRRLDDEFVTGQLLRRILAIPDFQSHRGECLQKD